MSPSRSARESNFSVCTLGLFAALLLAAGCDRSGDSAALDSDANGFYCAACKTKFYTERKVFPNRCPQCRGTATEMVMGYVCPEDKHMTLAPRGRGAACEQCRKFATAVVIPREADLKSWGARKCTAAEVE